MAQGILRPSLRAGRPRSISSALRLPFARTAVGQVHTIFIEALKGDSREQNHRDDARAETWRRAAGFSREKGDAAKESARDGVRTGARKNGRADSACPFRR